MSRLPKEFLEMRAKTLHQIQLESALSKPIGYSPQQIRRAYRVNKLIKRGITGKGQHIAIIDAFGSPTVKKDLEIFSKRFGLPRPKLKIYFPQWKPNQVNHGWALETALDVQWAHALAPDATIHLVVTKSNSLTDLFRGIKFANRLGVQVVSMSFGADEFPPESDFDKFFQKRGTVYVASSGDTGGSRLYPAASPFVVAVGGTTLPLDRKGHRIGPEKGWSGSGGGPSNFEPEPKYQTEFTIESGGRRAIPDVSFIADPHTGVSVFTSTPTSHGTTGWIIVGGTSLSAPCWSAIIALADMIRKKPLTDGHQALYKIATGTKRYSRNYRDITIGCAKGFCCTPGYDFVTGLGSPRANHLVLSLGGHRKKH